MVGRGAGQPPGGGGDQNGQGRGTFLTPPAPGSGIGRGWNIPNPGIQFGDMMQGMSNAHVNPLFLSNSDHPGMVLVSNLFNGANFTSWSRGVKMALGAKVKLRFITGSCVKPAEGSDDFDNWMRADQMVMCWLFNSMTREVAESLMYVETARERWHEVKERFVESNDPLVYQMRRDLANLRQENMSVGAYFGKLSKIWDELKSLDAIPVCNCGGINGCSCGLLKRIVDSEEKAKVMQFLMGLNDVYENLEHSNGVCSNCRIKYLIYIFDFSIS